MHQLFNEKNCLLVTKKSNFSGILCGVHLMWHTFERKISKICLNLPIRVSFNDENLVTLYPNVRKYRQYGKNSIESFWGRV
jgi:hypothetical protein